MVNDVKLTESGSAKSEQLLVMSTESLTNREWPGELLSGSECRRASWFLDKKYQTCLWHYRCVVGHESTQRWILCYKGL